MTQPILQNKHKNTTVDEIDFTINNILKEFGLSEKITKFYLIELLDCK